MQVNALKEPTQTFDPAAIAAELVPGFAAQAAAHDAEERFVAENYAELKRTGLVTAAVPAELGGGGASHAQLSDMLRTLAKGCGSTALAFAMHTHPIALAAWRWRHGELAVEPMLRKIAGERLIVLSSGGSDWLPGGGKAEPVEGGWRINARKAFASGAPAANLFVTSAVWDDPAQGATVLHFGAPMNAPGVRIEENWHAMGMRGTGSHDVIFENVFVPDAAIAGRRPAGVWHRLFHIISMVAIPLIYSVYVGVAEAARDIAVRESGRRREDAATQLAIGEMETELHAAQIALADMIANAAGGEPGPESTNRAMKGRALVARGVIRTAELALEAVGGAGYRRDLPLERMFRDMQGARYHPLPGKAQTRLAGRLALGLGPDG